MASPLFFKSLVGVGGVSVVTTGAVIGIPKLLAEKEYLVSELIAIHNPEKRLITSTEVGDSAWKKSWQDYRTVNKNAAKDNDTFKLPDWNGPISQDITSTDTVKSFLDACFSNSKKKVVTGSKLYEEVLRYCTRDTTIFDLVTESKRIPLSKTTQNANSPEWRSAWNSYVRDNSDDTGDAWNINSYGTEKAKVNQDHAVSEDFRSKCETNLASTLIKDAKLIEQVKSWCTKVAE
ncbi:hypothetical protein MHC_04660 [Mycoplasma haemocanis str. Illinois]|uniref:Uncharacterized protein n=1 Tax=Mycoplasma haemocanis (strain Illinois) TaxID=1111676 RepID=H6N816_MYCHN|nr:hypothetical protein [Mycoplasma haemocanis]AEW45788.1 hypothetical protein MHC_04660 [Mycoplasma haemocanis str. Illinois]